MGEELFVLVVDGNLTGTAEVVAESYQNIAKHNYRKGQIDQTKLVNANGLDQQWNRNQGDEYIGGLNGRQKDKILNGLVSDQI